MDIEYFWGRWFFLGSMGIFVRAGIMDHGMNWDGLFCKYGYLEAIFVFCTGWIMKELLGFPSEESTTGQGQVKHISGSSRMCWDWLVDSWSKSTVISIVLVCFGSLGEIRFLCVGWYNGRSWLATGCTGQKYGMDRTRWVWDGWTGGSKRRMRSSAIGFWCAAGR